MGEIDKHVKSYVKIPEIFAQLFNECFFDQEHSIQTGELTEQDSVLTTPEDKTMERIRDVCMLSTSGMTYRIILGVEEQTDIHYYMPVRVMQMDAMNYERQCRQSAVKAREAKAPFPPTAGMPKGSTIYPVMTIVLYLGEKKWDGPLTLYDLFDIPLKEKDWLAKYVVNYPLHLIDARHMSETELERFTGDLKIFFTLLREKYDEETIKSTVAKYPDTWYTLAVVKGDNRYRECATMENNKHAKGEHTMDPNLDRIENKGFQRGISQGLHMVNELVKKLLAEGRNDELQRSLEDEAFQQKLLKEYGLLNQ